MDLYAYCSLMSSLVNLRHSPEPIVVQSELSSVSPFDSYEESSRYYENKERYDTVLSKLKAFFRYDQLPVRLDTYSGSVVRRDLSKETSSSLLLALKERNCTVLRGYGMRTNEFVLFAVKVNNCCIVPWTVSYVPELQLINLRGFDLIAQSDGSRFFRGNFLRFKNDGRS